MASWWVNQLGTHKIQIPGNHLWAPISPDPGHRSMNLVRPGDIVFSHVRGEIIAVGIAQSEPYYSLKCTEIREAKLHPNINWSNEGMRIDTDFEKLENPIVIDRIVDQLMPMMQPKYAPLNKNGKANQRYLYRLTREASDILLQVIGNHNFHDNDLNRRSIHELTDNQVTERVELRKSRVGQGRFRTDVMKRWNDKCSITSANHTDLLVASHIKPWRDCKGPEEKLDGKNGLLLLANYDAAFDKGYITFDAGGKIIISDYLHSPEHLGIDSGASLRFGFSESEEYLNYHRKNIFRSHQNGN